MLNEHFQSARGKIGHGDLSVLFPVENLRGPVLQGRDTELALADTDEENVMIIAPTSPASSYFITQHTLTAIPVEELGPEV